MDGFTPMNAVLVTHGIERSHFTDKTLETYHSVRGFRTLMHEYVLPNVITFEHVYTGARGVRGLIEGACPPCDLSRG